MSIVHEREGVTLYVGDCLSVLRELPSASVDALVTDPPYGVGFMAQEWDTFRTRGSVESQPRAFQAWTERWAREALRVLKPGAHALIFGGTRTYHRLTAGLEDAGF